MSPIDYRKAISFSIIGALIVYVLAYYFSPQKTKDNWFSTAPRFKWQSELNNVLANQPKFKRQKRIVETWPTLRIGMSVQDIKDSLGEPSEIENIAAKDSTPKRPNGYSYGYLITETVSTDEPNMDSTQWVTRERLLKIQFDANDMVIDVEHWKPEQRSFWD